MSAMCFGDSCKSADHSETLNGLGCRKDGFNLSSGITLITIFFITVDIMRLPRNPKICT